MGDLTAKDFEKPLLVALGQLSGFTKEFIVPAENTYQPVMDILGISDINAHGTNSATGLPMVTKWIQWAFKSLREQGFATAPEGTRGKWSLTVAGTAEAHKLERQMSTTATSTPQDTVSVPYGRGFEDNNSYHQDPYIRNLALNQCSCKGNWSDRSPACKVCSLTGTCRNLQAALLSQLARALDAEDVASRTPAAPDVEASVTDAVAKPDPTGPAPADGFNASNYDWGTGEPIVVRVDTPCTYCQNTIKKGDKGIWVEPFQGLQAEIGMFHDACAKKAEAGTK